MMQVLLKGAAREKVCQLAALGYLDDQVLVITQDCKMSWIARFTERENLGFLRAQRLGEAYPGLDVYLFGIDEFPKNASLELSFFPSRYTNGEQPPEQPELNMSFLFNVTLRSERPARMPKRIAAAG
jgi:hypothetical protein